MDRRTFIQSVAAAAAALPFGSNEMIQLDASALDAPLPSFESLGLKKTGEFTMIISYDHDVKKFCLTDSAGRTLRLFEDVELQDGTYRHRIDIPDEVFQSGDVEVVNRG